MPLAGLHASHNLYLTILAMILWGVRSYYDDPHFADEKTEVCTIHSCPCDWERNIFLAPRLSSLAPSLHHLPPGSLGVAHRPFSLSSTCPSPSAPPPPFSPCLFTATASFGNQEVNLYLLFAQTQVHYAD